MKLSVKHGLLIGPILTIALSATAQSSIAADQVDPYDDGRAAIMLAPDERILILEEMRAFLETVQSITEYATEGDMEAVTEVAKTMGMGAAGGVPRQTMAKLPEDFRMMAGATHRAFDELALSASVSDDPVDVLGELASLMYNCTGCHATFRLGLESE